MRIVYYSLTGQIRRFIKKTEITAIEITNQNPQFELDEEYILVAPSYDADVIQPLYDFINYKNNSSLIKAVVGSGNRNFGENFAMTAKSIAKEYNIPLVFTFEFNGTSQDVENFKKVVQNLDA